MKVLLLVLTLMFCLMADTYVASSVERADVSTAITAATDGDSVYIPSGTNSTAWTSGFLITKGIRIGGAGMNSTRIKMGGGSYAFKYNPSSPVKDSVYSIQNLTINCDSVDGVSGIRFEHTGDTVFVDNILIRNVKILRVKNYSETAIVGIDGNIAGVMTGCKIDSCSAMIFNLHGDNANSWAVPLQLGSAKYFYFEACSTWNFGTSAYITDSGWGTRWVIRYCFFDMSHRDFGIFDAHGNLSSVRGTIGCAIYGNTIANCADRGDGLMSFDLRGGSFQVYNNTFTGSESRGDITIREEDCDGVDEEPDCTYPGIDPIHDAYLWNNPYNSSEQVLGLGNSNQSTEMILENRDWWDDLGSGDDNFTWGTYSSRPATCATNDCYWSTDTKTLYRAVATNDWDSVYHEFTYPHPLFVAGGGEEPPINTKTRNILKVKR